MKRATRNILLELSRPLKLLALAAWAVAVTAGPMETATAIEPPTIATTPAEATEQAIPTAPSWVSFRTIWFMANRSTLDDSEARKIADVAAYADLNPAAQIAINQSADFTDFAVDTQTVNNRRIETIRAALIAAGVVEERIQVGPLGDLPASLDRRVVVLVRAGT